MAKKSTLEAVDYNIVGITPSDLTEDISRSFVRSLEKKIRPASHMVVGPPGVGKTFSIYAAARIIEEQVREPVELICLPTSTLEPVDIGGIPHVEKDCFVYKAPHWAYRASTLIKNGGPMILFADDITAAHPQTQAAFFKGVHEGMFGDVQLRNNVMIVAAGNRASDNASAYDMPTALASRFIWHYFRVSAKDWINWATRSGKILPEFIAYIGRHPGALHDFTPEAQEKPYPCPRSWEIASNRVDVFGIDDSQLFRRLAGVIGQGHATNFASFLKFRNKLVAPTEIVKNPKKAKIHEPRELDAMYITISALNVYCTNNPTVENCIAAIQYICRKEMLGEIGFLTSRHICRYVVRDLLPQADRIKFTNHPEVNAYIMANSKAINAVGAA